MASWSFEVRKATMDDIEEIRQITKEAFEKYVELAGLTDKIEALQETYEDVKRDIETKEVFVAYIDGIPVGSARVEIRDDHTAYLSRFGVRLHYQNHGVGKAIMNVIDMAMKELGVKKLYLHTASKVFSLVRFYYGRGFYIDSTTKDRGYIRALLCKEYE